MFTQERQPIFHEVRLTSNSLNSARADLPEAWIGAFTSFVITSNGAAARLGVKRSTLQLRLKRLGIRLSRTAVDDRKQTAQ